jgi:multidrug resistance efflux pump
MHERARIVIPILLITLLTYGGYRWWNEQARAAELAGVITGTGTIEAEEVLITAEIAGRVRQLMADEGQPVAAGAALAQLDTALLEAQLAQTQAAVQAAEANLALVRAGARSEELAAAEAEVSRALALRDGAAAALAHAQAILADPQEIDVQVVQAQAARDAAARALERLRAGARPEEIAQAEAANAQAQVNIAATRDRLSLAKTQAEAQVAQATETLTQAQARYAQAKYNWEYVQETGNDPIAPEVYVNRGGSSVRVPNRASDGARENYYAQFVQAEATLRQAEEAVALAVAQADTARQAEITGIASAEEQANAADAALARLRNGAARPDLAQAETALASAQRTLDAVLAIRENPQQLHAAVDAARAQLGSAEAQLAQARARYELLRAGARPEQIQAAEAQLAQAKAVQQQVEVQLAKATLTAPRAGVILARPIHEGEAVNPGTPLMAIGATETARLTIYVSETQIGLVRPGQAAEVHVDTFPDRTFAGVVAFIAQQAEFTPRNVQTQDERATTVFAVRIDLPNADGALKPGMPADAVLR